MRKIYKVVKSLHTGSYVKGVWVADKKSEEMEIEASVQPAKQIDYDILNLREDGAVKESVVRVYTDCYLNSAGNTKDKSVTGDIIVIRGSDYMIRDKSEWQSGLINHYRYLAVKYER